MSESKEQLKFSVHVERKVATKQYESATVGVWKEYYQGETPEDYAFGEVRRLVEEFVEEMRL